MHVITLLILTLIPTDAWEWPNTMHTQNQAKHEQFCTKAGLGKLRFPGSVDKTTLRMAKCQVGNGATFGDTLKDSSGPGFCIKRAINPDLKSGDIGIAHRSLPCNSKVLLINPKNGKHVYATVVDRGPYGAATKYDDRATWYVKFKNHTKPTKKVCRVLRSRGLPCKPLPYRSVADLTPRAKHLLNHSGMGPIVVIPVGKRRTRPNS